jgi:hypothetical protein
MKIAVTFFSILLFSLIAIKGQDVPYFFKSAGSPANPKVKIMWNTYYTYEGLTDLCNKIATAYPDLAQVSSIGKSYEGRDMILLTVTNFKNKKSDEKPGYYIDGNIHSNEVQGSEIALYTAWYLTEMYGANDFIHELLNDKVFYIIPTINPDARNNFMLKPNNMHSPRSGMIPVDDDRDGITDEDGFDDLDGDGSIAYMRRKTPFGRYNIDPENPDKMIRTDATRFGQYEFLDDEGMDNDGDGQVNEDPTGYYDPNRDWSFNWQPDYIQDGALPYPFYAPENLAVRNFVVDHPNIAGAQSYHNYGGQILRGPAQSAFTEFYDNEDEALLNTVGRMGEKMLPGYKFITLWKDLYPVYGGEIDWFYGARGIYVFSNELFTEQMYFGKEQNTRNDILDFDKYLLFDDAAIPWKPFNHPQYGKIEIGGTNKNFGRPDPGFLLESDAHRNMAFTIYHAYQTPLIEIDTIEVRDAGKGMQEVTVSIVNKRISPTRSGQCRKHNIDPKDRVTIQDVKALGKMIVKDRDLNISEVQTGDPSVIFLDNIPGMTVLRVRWITEKSRHFRVTVESAKGGKITASY